MLTIPDGTMAPRKLFCKISRFFSFEHHYGPKKKVGDSGEGLCARGCHPRKPSRRSSQHNHRPTLGNQQPPGFMNNDYLVLKAIREYSTYSNHRIAKICGTTAKSVRYLRYTKPKVDPTTGIKLNGTYFITDQHGRVKIGSSANVLERLNSIQVGNADKLTLLAVCEENEVDLHKKFNRDHIRGEWFTLSDKIKDYLL